MGKTNFFKKKFNNIDHRPRYSFILTNQRNALNCLKITNLSQLMCKLLKICDNFEFLFPG